MHNDGVLATRKYRPLGPTDIMSQELVNIFTPNCSSREYFLLLADSIICTVSFVFLVYYRYLHLYINDSWTLGFHDNMNRLILVRE